MLDSFQNENTFFKYITYMEKCQLINCEFLKKQTAAWIGDCLR